MKTIIVYAFVLLTALVSQAATESRLNTNRPGIGVHAGLNFETAKTPADVSSETYTGFTVGAGTEINFTRNFSLQPEINYSRRGVNLISIGNARADVLYHSIEVPVFARLSVGEEVRPFIFAGPMGVWNVSTEVKGSLGGTTASTSFDPKTFDVAAVGGAGIELGTFFADARYVVGILDIDENSADYKSRGFRVMAGFHL